MPTLPLPINFGANKDIEEIGLTTDSAAAYDVYFDSNGNVARRPALVLLCNLGVSAAIDGLYWWDRQEMVIAICNGRIFKITDSSGTNSEISGDTFQAGTRPYWADFGTALYGANGGKIVAIPSSGSAAYIADADAPTTVSHVAVIDDFLVALSIGTQQAHYATVSDPTDWPGSWVTALAFPDLLKALGVKNDTLELLGTHSLEGWRNDGSTPFVKETQLTMDRGTVAPHSFIYIEGYWYLLDHERKVIRIGPDRSSKLLSLTMNKYIQGFSTVADAIGSHTTFEGRPQYVLNFPTEGKCLAYDIYGKTWTELGYWNSGTSSYDNFLGKSFCIATKWNLALVGDRSTGKVYKFDTSVYQDDSSTLRSMVRTPWIHRDRPDAYKRTQRLDFYLKKANVAQESDAAELILKYRDDGATSWNTERTVSLGRVGKTGFHGRLRQLGRYRSRQYEIALSDNSPLVISKVLETFIV